VGQDVVAALRAELAAQGVEAEVPAIMNDTVATLVGGWLTGGLVKWVEWPRLVGSWGGRAWVH